MKGKSLLLAIVIGVVASDLSAQDLNPSTVPAAVKVALVKKYPSASASKITWEKDNANYEANWGGKSGEDNSVLFTPAGAFVEIVNPMPISQLPPKAILYIKEKYKGVKILEAGRVTDAHGTLTYEAELKGMDLFFDTQGNFLKKD